MKYSPAISYHPAYRHPVAEGHRFPMIKYELLYNLVKDKFPIIEPTMLDWNIAALTHDHDYLNKLKNLSLTDKEQRAIGFIQTQALIDRERYIMQGTLDMALHALNHGRGFNIAGGTHHAFADRGEGFCILNDFAIAINYLLDQNKIQKALVIDLDVHQGNGTAAIFKNEPRVFTLSIHGKNNYPFHKEESDLDIPLPDGIGDQEYINILQETIPQIIKQENPDIIFYQSGVDILYTDQFGKMNISLEGVYNRDRIIMEIDKPIVVAMGGGYSKDIDLIVEAHLGVFKPFL